MSECDVLAPGAVLNEMQLIVTAFRASRQFDELSAVMIAAIERQDLMALERLVGVLREALTALREDHHDT